MRFAGRGSTGFKPRPASASLLYRVSKNATGGVRRAAGEGVILLHSDRQPLDDELRQRATDSGLRVLSTTDPSARVGQVVVDLYDSPSFFTVTTRPKSIRSIAAATRERFEPALGGEPALSTNELTEAISAYSARKATALLPVGTTISLPTNSWVKDNVEKGRQEARAQTTALLAELRSSNEAVVKRAASRLALAGRAGRFSPDQVEQIVTIMHEQGETWRTDLGPPPDCPHKTNYTERSTKYYAASVVTRGRLAVDPQVKKEAAEALEDGKRTQVEDDPGWI